MGEDAVGRVVGEVEVDCGGGAEGGGAGRRAAGFVLWHFGELGGRGAGDVRRCLRIGLGWFIYLGAAPLGRGEGAARGEPWYWVRCEPVLGELRPIVKAWFTIDWLVEDKALDVP